MISTVIFAVTKSLGLVNTQEPPIAPSFLEMTESLTIVLVVVEK